MLLYYRIYWILKRLKTNLWKTVTVSHVSNLIGTFCRAAVCNLKKKDLYVTLTQRRQSHFYVLWRARLNSGISILFAHKSDKVYVYISDSGIQIQIHLSLLTEHSVVIFITPLRLCHLFQKLLFPHVNWLQMYFLSHVWLEYKKNSWNSEKSR